MNRNRFQFSFKPYLSVQIAPLVRIKKIRCHSHIYLKKKEILDNNLIITGANLSSLLAWIKIIDGKHDNDGLLYDIFWRMYKKKSKTFTNDLSQKLVTGYNDYINRVVVNRSSLDITIEQTGILSELLIEELCSSINIISPQLNILKIANLYGQIIAMSDPLIDYMEDQEQSDEPYIKTVAEFLTYHERVISLSDKLISHIKIMNDHGTANNYFCNVFFLGLNALLRKIKNEKKILMN